MSDYNLQAVLDERHAQEDRLAKEGYEVYAGGTDLRTGEWDISVFLPDSNPINTRTVMLHGMKDVDTFIESGGKEGGQRFMDKGATPL